jgi:hypothetical protein
MDTLAINFAAKKGVVTFDEMIRIEPGRSLKLNYR